MESFTLEMQQVEGTAKWMEHLMLVKASRCSLKRRMMIWTCWSLIRNSTNFSNSSRCACRLFTTSRRIAACWAVRKVVVSLSWGLTFQTIGCTKSENAVRISPQMALLPRWNLGMTLTSSLWPQAPPMFQLLFDLIKGVYFSNYLPVCTWTVEVMSDLYMDTSYIDVFETQTTNQTLNLYV